MPNRLFPTVVTLLMLLISAKSMPGAIAEGELRGHGGPVRAVIALADDRLATGGFDSAVIVWDAKAGAARQVLRGHGGTVNALAALPGGCFASAGEDTRVVLWCGGAEPSRIFTGHSAPVAALAASPDGRLLASAGWDNEVRVWTLSDGGVRVIKDHRTPVNAVAFLAGGASLLSAGHDGQLRMTDLAGGRAAVTAELHSPVNAVAIAGDEIVTVGADGIVRLFDLALRSTGEIALSAGPLTTVAASPDGATLAVAGLRTPVTMIDRQTRSTRFEILGPGLPVWSVAFSPDGATLYTGGADRAVRRWITATGKPAGDVAPGVDLKPEAASEPGARVFRACRACHGLAAADTNLAGPTLHGVFGRKIGSAPGYTYSDALKNGDIVWSANTISKLFEIGPTAYTPGTKMPEQRITDPEDRKALVEWLAKVTAQ